MTEPLVYLNGHMTPASEAHLAIYDTGIVLGATVTDQARTFRRRLFRLDDHLDRLMRGLRTFGFDIGLTKENLAAISQQLIDHNAALLPPDAELGLIQFVTAGEYGPYAGMSGRTARTTPTVCIHTFQLPLANWADRLRYGAHLVTPQVRHVPPECYDPSVKYRSRLHYYRADQEARRIDPAAAALLLDLRSNVTETSTANFLIGERGKIVSPTLANILPGISRQTVIELAERLGIEFVECDFDTARAIQAEEALLASTPFCLLPVTRINGGTIGDGRPGPIFERLLAAWSELVGVDIRQQILEAATA